MGSVISNPPLSVERKSSRKKLYFFIFMMYFIGAFAFIAIGLQPAKNSAAVYASESESATSKLQIQSIGLDAPVTTVNLNGDELEVPEEIAGSYSVHQNKTLIIGHSSTIFQKLHLVSIGDNFTFQNKSYQITNITEKPKSDISMKEILKAEAKDTIIIMTCSGDPIENSNGDHTHRLIITAELL